MPAGTFDCFRVDWVRNDVDLLRQPQRIENRGSYWIAPDRVRRHVAREEEAWSGSSSNMRKTVSERMELMFFTQS